jgi:aminomethyltransferase
MWLEDFWPVHYEGKVVGKLTSASRSFRLEKNIGYAWVPIELAEPGTKVELESPDGMVPAATAPLPFWDAAKDVPKKGSPR